MLVAEKRLQMAAHRLGLRVIADRHARRMTGQYLLRPISNARRVVQILPDGNYCLAPFWEWNRRHIGTRLSLDEVEKFLARYEPMPDDVAERDDVSRRPVSAPVERRSKGRVWGPIGGRVGPVDLTQNAGPS
jgi:hypothetical protein